MSGDALLLLKDGLEEFCRQCVVGPYRSYKEGPSTPRVVVFSP